MQVHSSADNRLRSFIDRVLRLKEEQDALAADIREVYAEAKGEGYDKTAMGALVSHLRKIEKAGADAVSEAETVFSLYLDAYQRATGTVVATHTHEAIDRQARSKVRMSESMDDAKALSAEAVALGLIDPAAHAETERIADAIANKFGSGVIDPETGELTDQEQPETATRPGQDVQSPIQRALADENLDVTAGETAPHSHSPATPAQAPQANTTDEAVKSSAASSVNPLCARPDTCQFAHSMASCSACAHAKSRAAV